MVDIRQIEQAELIYGDFLLWLAEMAYEGIISPEEWDKLTGSLVGWNY